VRNLSLGMRHLVNAYEVKAGIGVIAVTLCDPCLSALRVLQKRALYKYIYLYLLPLSAMLERDFAVDCTRRSVILIIKSTFCSVVKFLLKGCVSVNLTYVK